MKFEELAEIKAMYKNKPDLEEQKNSEIKEVKQKMEKLKESKIQEAKSWLEAEKARLQQDKQEFFNDMKQKPKNHVDDLDIMFTEDIDDINMDSLSPDVIVGQSSHSSPEEQKRPNSSQEKETKNLPSSGSEPNNFDFDFENLKMHSVDELPKVDDTPSSPIPQNLPENEQEEEKDLPLEDSSLQNRKDDLKKLMS